MMKKNDPRILSCFIDETGDFGDYDPHCQYYLVSAVLHDQSISIQKQLDRIEYHLSTLGLPHHALHAGPLLRRESDYAQMQMEDRKKLFNLLFNFARNIPVKYFSAKVKKSECKNVDELYTKLTKSIINEVLKSKNYWNSFDKIIIYYDNGQKALKQILNIVFNSIFPDVEVRKVQPADYRLFQVADLLCTLELTHIKIELGQFSKTEDQFFHGSHDFKKEYWRKIKKMRI